MAYNRKLTALGVLSAVVALVTIFSAGANADPLPGRDVLKFQQLPMVATQIDGAEYNGHDELSMLYGFPELGDPGPIGNTIYQGTSMADDFADPFNTPVVHVRWWGSYLGNSINPESYPIDRFLIAFESDLPADQNTLPPPFGGFSHPDQVLSAQIVNRGPLLPGSGTYTETLILPAPAGGEDIYEYNAELHLAEPFPQEPGTVYWIKIAALMDIQDENQDGVIDILDLGILAAEGPRWGWHNRDYTVPDPFALAVTPFPVQPGERDEAGELGIPFPTEVWHFQDDAVSNNSTQMMLDPNMPDMPLDLFQEPFAFSPQSYVEGLDGPEGIGQFSKDLAFELYTIPEPGTCLLLMLALGAIVTLRRTIC